MSNTVSNEAQATAYARLARANDGRLGIWTCPACQRDIHHFTLAEVNERLVKVYDGTIDRNCLHASQCQALQECAS